MMSKATPLNFGGLDLGNMDGNGGGFGDGSQGTIVHDFDINKLSKMSDAELLARVS